MQHTAELRAAWTQHDIHYTVNQALKEGRKMVDER